MEEAFRLAKEAGDRTRTSMRAYNNIASTLTDFASDLPRAKQIAEEGLEMARRAGGTGWIAWIEGTIGGIDLLLGDLEAGEAWTRASLQHAILAGDQPLAGTRYVDLALILVLRGDPTAADEFALGAAILDEQPEPQVTPTLRRVEAALTSDEEDAVRYLWQGAEDLARVLRRLGPARDRRARALTRAARRAR